MNERQLWDVWPVGEERVGYRPVRAMDAEDAATEFAAKYDQDEHSLLDGTEMFVFVAPHDGSEEPIRLLVSGEPVPTYYAREPSDCPPHAWQTYLPRFEHTTEGISRDMYRKRAELLISSKEECLACGMVAEKALAEWLP